MAGVSVRLEANWALRRRSMPGIRTCSKEHAAVELFPVRRDALTGHKRERTISIPDNDRIAGGHHPDVLVGVQGVTSRARARVVGSRG